VDSSLRRENPFVNGEHIGCYAVFGENGDIKLIPPTRDVATFWAVMMGKGNTKGRYLSPPSAGGDPTGRSEHTQSWSENLTPEPSARSGSRGRSRSHRSDQDGSHRSASPRQEIIIKSPKQEIVIRTNDIDLEAPTVAVKESSAVHWDQQEAPDRAESECSVCTELLTAKDLSEFCGIPQDVALNSIRAINERGDDHLNYQDFELLKGYFKERDIRTQQRAEPPKPPTPPPALRVTDRNPRNRVGKSLDAARDAVILHGRGKKYKVDVILGDANVQIGNAQVAYDQITAIHSSYNCCLAIMTKKGRILLQCSSPQVRDHWQRTLTKRSQTVSIDEQSGMSHC